MQINQLSYKNFGDIKYSKINKNALIFKKNKNKYIIKIRNNYFTEYKRLL